MTLRERQTELTKAAILDAAAELLLKDGDPDAFTVQNIADAAGVAHRTVYRHFSTRQELINAVGARLDEQVGQHPDRLPPTFDEWIAGIDTTVAFARTHPTLIKRGYTVSYLSGTWRTDRDDHFWSLFRNRFPHFPDDEARQAFAGLRHMYSAAASLELSERFGLDFEQTTSSLKRSVEALIADIDRRDQAAKTAGA